MDSDAHVYLSFSRRERERGRLSEALLMKVEQGTLEAGERKEEVGEEDGHHRDGTVWTATAHCITAVIGSGVLGLVWSVAQLGWIAGPVALVAFAAITYYASLLLADCYRSPHPVTGSRNHTYMEAVESYLGNRDVVLCVSAQYANLWGTLVSYTITSALSMMSVMRSTSYHKHGPNAKCEVSGNSFMIAFGAVQILLSQLPNLNEISWLSIVAAVMSFAYSLISLVLCMVRWISNGVTLGTLTGDVGRDDGRSQATKIWGGFQALGNIAFAYTFSAVLIEIQDTLKSPPSESVTMKKANLYGIGTTTAFYVSLGCIGYAAFGNDAPGNVLTGFYNPFWIVDIAHVCIVIHLVGAYQVCAQPIFAPVEKRLHSKWPEAKFLQKAYKIPGCNLSFNLSKLVLRSIFIVFTTFISILLPFFNAIMGLLGALSFSSLTVYFPVKMHLLQTEVRRGKVKWFFLHGLCILCFLISLISAIGSVAGIVDSLRGGKPLGF